MLKELYEMSIGQKLYNYELIKIPRKKTNRNI